MLKKMVNLVIVGLLTTTCYASCPEIAGWWTSSSGSHINICYPGNPDRFTIQVTDANGSTGEYTAFWTEGFRIQFYYMVRNRQYSGVYDPEHDTIQVTDESGRQYWWSR